jgi:drug/metabolite transporter (DMT)-like permease
MANSVLRSEVLLFIAAAIWGFAFVAQRAGMEYVGPFTFNGVRFALGCLALVPLLMARRASRNHAGKALHGSRDHAGEASRGGLQGKLLRGCWLAGIVLFAGASLQQVGMVYTTAGKAGFITGLYVIIVPILGLFWGHRPGLGTWAGAFIAALGLYFLSIGGSFSIARGDFLVLLSAFFWAGHVLIIGWLSSRIDTAALAFTQFAVCSLLSLIVAIAVEEIALQSLLDAAIPIVYGGVFSVGVAYTLQVAAQRHAPPARAAIILSLETVFAALGGWLLLSEAIPPRGLIGCALMLAGILLSQRTYFADYHAGSVQADSVPENK